MTLDKTAWYVRLFFLSEDVKRHFYNSRIYFRDDDTKTNLCYFVRSIVFHLPFFLVTQLLLCTLAVSLIVMPIIWWGPSLTLTVLNVLAMTGVTIAGMLGVFMIEGAASTFFDRQRSKSRQRALLVEKGLVTPTGWEVFVIWLKKKKQGICPMIEINKGAAQ